MAGSRDPIPARCPSCQAPGPLGEPCPERICALRGYCRVPVADLPHAEGVGVDQNIGLRFGDYLLVGLIGAGGFGKVYRALQLPVGMPAAVKVLDIESGPAAMAQVKQSKFEIEAQALARLSHPNIVRLYQYGQHHVTPYLAMELVEGAVNLWGEVEARALTHRPFSLDEVEAILMQVLAALEAAHARDIVHRDIKPENIMLQVVPGHGLFVKVLDFGLAKFVDERSATSMLLGTPAYMAPEQLTRGRIGPWTDVYGLGVVAFELVCGQRPFPAASVQETITTKLDPRFDPWARVAGLGLPHEVRAFFARCLCLEIEARHHGVGEMREGLEVALAALRRSGVGRGLSVMRLVEPTASAPEPEPSATPLPDPTRRMARPPSDEERERVVAGPPTESPVAARAEWQRPAVVQGASVPAKRGSARAIAGALAVAGGIVGVGLAVRGGGEGTRPAPVVDVSSEGGGASAAGRDAAAPRDFVRVGAGRFARGSAPHDPAAGPDELLHEVVLGHDLVVDTSEVTQRQWAELFATRPWRHDACGERCPVENVSWWDAVAFANARSQRDGLASCYQLVGCQGAPGDGTYRCDEARLGDLACPGWRLPTEAEWEYVARAQSPPPELSKVAWYAKNSGADHGVVPCAEAGRAGAARCGVHPVAQRAPNAWGIFDLFGNVREWVHDGYGPYPAGSVRGQAGSARVSANPPLEDPVGNPRAEERVIRGGSFLSPPERLRAAGREHASPGERAIDLGFRLVRTEGGRR